MKSFIVKLIFNLNNSNCENGVKFEEQVHLIKANSLIQAFIKAKKIGETEDCQWSNAKNEILKWQFVNVLDIIALDQLNDGQQLYTHSRIEMDNEDFKDYVHLRSNWIQKELTHM